MRNRPIMLAAAAVLLPVAVFAAGGGGGGGGGTECTSDSFICGDWSPCSAEGVQSRSCTQSFDCASVNTPSPAATQSCTPPPPPAPTCIADVWSCSDWGTCLADGSQARNCTLQSDCPGVSTLKPSEGRTCAAPSPSAPHPQSAQTCDTDTFTCGAWSACDAYGNETRTCTPSFDCPTVITPAPAKVQRCGHLQCGGLATLRERVTCRVNLTPAGIARELEIQYLPEECRSFDGAARETCVARYKAFGSCWSLPVGESRLACARKVLGLNRDVAGLSVACKAKVGVARDACLATLREQVYGLIKFRFYDLEERAEDFFERGVPTDKIAELAVAIETQKQQFNGAKTFVERRDIIQRVRDAWKTFVEQSKPFIH